MRITGFVWTNNLKPERTGFLSGDFLTFASIKTSTFQEQKRVCIIGLSFLKKECLDENEKRFYKNIFVDTYIGIITPEGVIKSEKKKYPLVGSRWGNMGFPKQYGSSARKGGRRSWETTGRMSFLLSCGSGRRRLTLQKKGRWNRSRISTINFMPRPHPWAGAYIKNMESGCRNCRCWKAFICFTWEKKGQYQR